MSDLESRISELERELALKKGFQAVKFVLPKNLPDDVATEIQNKLREIADSLALKKDQLSPDNTPTTFNSEEVAVIKMLAQSALKRSVPVTTSVITATVAPTELVQKPAPIQKKAKLILTENIRGEAKKYATVDDEVFVSDSNSVDAHGMVSATHMRRGGMMRVPLDDLEFLP